MNKYEELNAALGTLTIFRKILDEPVVSRLRELLYSLDTSRAAELYCAFVHELYKSADSITDWVTDYVAEDENPYIDRVISGVRPGPALEERLDAELLILDRLAALDCDGLTAQLNCALPLPRFESRPADIAAVCRGRIAEIPTKGYGIFARYHMFTLDENGSLVPVRHPDPQTLDSLYGYERERETVLRNTVALVEGRGANNVLLYGDAGTGKSSTVKAIANALKDRGLRLIEVRRDQLYLLPGLMDSLEGSPLKFIIFIDDLSFGAGDSDFAALKAILEGSVSSRGCNTAVYATSNRRHLVKETMSDRDGDDIHASDTRQEQLSLSARFGLTVTFLRPEKELYCEIVEKLARESGLSMDRDRLLVKAEAYAIRGGGRSPRAAKQFIELLSQGVIE